MKYTNVEVHPNNIKYTLKLFRQHRVYTFSICYNVLLKHTLYTHTHTHVLYIVTFLNYFGGSGGKASACSAGDLGSIPGSGRPPGEGNGNPLQYSCPPPPKKGLKEIF